MNQKKSQKITFFFSTNSVYGAKGWLESNFCSQIWNYILGEDAKTGAIEQNRWRGPFQNSNMREWYLFIIITF